jgi:hypothetical protein
MDELMNESNELELLRSFFQAWEYMHSLRSLNSPESLRRMQMEFAAQKLVDAAHEVQSFNREQHA